MTEIKNLQQVEDQVEIVSQEMQYATLTKYIGFEHSLCCATTEEFQKALKSMYGGVVPQAGHIIEWVVDTVEQTETGFKATGHFRSRPDTAEGPQ